MKMMTPAAAEARDEVEMDETELARRLGEALMRRGWSLTTAESCTGGWVAQAVTAIAGSSQWFERGFVTYSNIAKIEMLGVRASTIERHGAVSEATVREMVAGALRYSHAQVALAVSGIAGPGGGSPEKPVGTVWLVWGGAARTHAVRRLFPGDRDAIRRQAVSAALQGMLEWVNDAG